MTNVCRAGSVTIGDQQPLAVIAGPCVLESRQLGLDIGGVLRDACARLGLAYVFKASFDKANRSSVDSPRGPGMDTGLAWLREIGEELGVPVTTDVHAPEQCDPAAHAVDILQIPAFLCRQTDLLFAAGRAAAARAQRIGRPAAVNIKKGQFLSPAEMSGPVGKLAQVGCDDILLTERGTFFGYGRLVNDFIGVAEMAQVGGGRPVCFDATHSTQRPGGKVTAGARDMAPMLARAAVAAGVDAVFLECHPEPEQALSDAATMLPLHTVPELLAQLAAIRAALARP